MVDAGSDNVSRAAGALIALGSRESLDSGGLGVLRLAELTGGDKGQLSRVLKTLAEHGLVERDPQSRNYRLGWRLFILASQAADQRLVELARPLLVQLVDRVGERANLTVRNGTQVFTVFSEASPRSVQSLDWVGRAVPAYCTSSGRALLFDHSRADLDTLFAATEFRQLGPNSPPDVATLYERIAADRARGFVLADEEFEPGLVAVAAPVRNVGRGICAAVNVSAPRFRLGDSRRLVEVGTAVKEVTDELTALLGGAADAAGQGDGPPVG